MTPEKKSHSQNDLNSDIKDADTKVNSRQSFKKKNKKKQKKGEQPSNTEDDSKQKLLKICNEYEWIHLSCAHWVAEVNIKQFDTKTDIAGIFSLKQISKT